MQLRDVVLADIPTMPGFERHTFRCSACPQVARRLVICRAKMPVVDPLVPSTAPEAPASNVQTGPPAAVSASPIAVDKLLEEQEATDWGSKSSAWPSKSEELASRASAWAKTVEKVRSRQMALEERAATARTTALVSEFNHTLNTPVGRATDLGTVSPSEIPHDTPGGSFKKRA
jgi:hypothetical protein